MGKIEYRCSTDLPDDVPALLVDMGGDLVVLVNCYSTPCEVAVALTQLTDVHCRRACTWVSLADIP